MIIFGTTGITSTQQKGSFHCPSCGAGAQFERKGVRRFFTLFFVPLIPLHRVADFIECKRCGGTFKPEVLIWNGTVPPPLPSGAPPLHSDPFGNPAGLPPAYSGVGAASATTVSFQANGAAKASMILGILGLLTSFLFCPSFLFIIASIILGIVGLSNVKKGNGLVAGKRAAIAGIVCSLAGTILMVVLAIAVARNPGSAAKKSPKYPAASKISGTSESIAHGNSPKARELAEKYATAMQLADSLSFLKSDKASTKRNRYIVYCELRDDSCAFLAYVPDYRRFDDDAKADLESMAWQTATRLLKDDGTLQQNARLCVALKGLVMFGSVMVGDLQNAGPQTSGKDETLMDPFFTELAESPAPSSAN